MAEVPNLWAAATTGPCMVYLQLGCVTGGPARTYTHCCTRMSGGLARIRAAPLVQTARVELRANRPLHSHGPVPLFPPPSGAAKPQRLGTTGVWD